MFDNISCEYPLPDGKTADDFSGLNFQTKSLECCLERYKITPEGLLLIFRYDLEETGETRPTIWDKTEMEPVYRRVNERWEPALCPCTRKLPYHGVVNFYSQDKTGTWCEYVAKFTDGVVESMWTACPAEIQEHPR